MFLTSCLPSIVLSVTLIWLNGSVPLLVTRKLIVCTLSSSLTAVAFVSASPLSKLLSLSELLPSPDFVIFSLDFSTSIDGLFSNFPYHLSLSDTFLALVRPIPDTETSSPCISPSGSVSRVPTAVTNSSACNSSSFPSSSNSPSLLIDKSLSL